MGNESEITPLAFYEHWLTVGDMYRNYVGVDPVFERTALGALRRPFLRWLGFPFYFGLANRGYGLRLNGKIAGVIYLQYRKMVAHINDIEVNRPFQGQKLSYHLLDFAQRQAIRRKKRFLTLVVTLSNSRALALYRKTGFLDQHHRYYYLSQLPLQATKTSPDDKGSKKLILRPLQGRAAADNLHYFFKHETHLSEPLTGEVWEALYPPRLPGRGRGSSYAVIWDNSSQPSGHADFFDWPGHGRWRIYLASDYWGSADERALLELLIRYNQVNGLSRLSILLGSASHHSKAKEIAQSLGFEERDSERMLMIKPV